MTSDPNVQLKAIEEKMANLEEANKKLVADLKTAENAKALSDRALEIATDAKTVDPPLKISSVEKDGVITDTFTRPIKDYNKNNTSITIETKRLKKVGK